jgi:GDPmannose 4,6-dehydratase
LPKAIVIGCNGQDGTLLCTLLHQKGYNVYGIDHMLSDRTQSFVRFSVLDVCDSHRMHELIATVSPDEVYYLAAYHHSAEEPDSLRETVDLTLEVNAKGLNNVLAAIADLPASKPRVFYAASSRVFGEPPGDVQDESTPLAPLCAYGISKAAGVHLCRYYRREHQVYASAGILYNHESPLRSQHFVTRKIVRAAVRISSGLEREIVLGDLDARVDWGWAPDYVEAMHAILRLACPDDFVLATGILHSVREFVEIAFSAVGLDWRQYVVERRDVLDGRRAVKPLCGHSGKLQAATGWRPRVSFEEMVRAMIAVEGGNRGWPSVLDFHSDL